MRTIKAFGNLGPAVWTPVVKAAILTSALMGACVTGWGQYSPPTNGLVGWWRGNGNANDSAGGHNGTLEGGMGFTNGVFGLAFAAGSGKRVYIPDDPAFALTSLTIGAWVNVHADSWVVAVREDQSNIAYSLVGNYDGTIGLRIFSSSQADFLFVPISYNRWHQVTTTLDSGFG
jgi:hypothetical protein